MNNNEFCEREAEAAKCLAEEPNLFEYSKDPSENIDLIYSAKSLLRYPGGKTRAIGFITKFFPTNLKVLLSPFFGGGSIELFMAAKGVKVKGYDIFSPLVVFWQCVLEDPYQLSLRVEKYFPLSKERFYELQKNQNIIQDKYELAAVYYVLNRSSFSGATLSGGMSPHHPRFTQTSIERLRRFYNPNLVIKEAHFDISLQTHPHEFAYLDPPYLIKSSLYGFKGDAHKEFDHEALANLLRRRQNWLMSYNDCNEIRDLYAGHHILTPNWKYGMSSNKSSKEILIFSKNFIVNGKYYN